MRPVPECKLGGGEDDDGQSDGEGDNEEDEAPTHKCHEIGELLRGWYLEAAGYRAREEMKQSSTAPFPYE